MKYTSIKRSIIFLSMILVPKSYSCDDKEAFWEVFEKEQEVKRVNEVFHLEMKSLEESSSQVLNLIENDEKPNDNYFKHLFDVYEQLNRENKIKSSQWACKKGVAYQIESLEQCWIKSKNNKDLFLKELKQTSSNYQDEIVIGVLEYLNSKFIEQNPYLLY